MVRSLQIEVERFNKLKYLAATIKIEGKEVYIKSEHEILIFRMYQECLSNVMKHSKAKKLDIVLNYKKDVLEISAKDDGVGFDPLQKSESSGLQTIKGRSELLNAKYLLTSEIEKGTNLTLIYPYTDEPE